MWLTRGWQLSDVVVVSGQPVTPKPGIFRGILVLEGNP